MENEDDTEKWIAPMEAVRIVRMMGHSDQEAKELIASWLRDGQVAAQARRLEPAPEKSGHGVHVGADGVDLSSTFWKSDDFWASVAKWKWHIGEFRVEKRDDLLTFERSTTAHGVTLNAIHIVMKVPEEVFEKHFATEAPPKERTTGVMTEPKWDWESALIELMGIAEIDGIVAKFELNTRGGQAKLEEWFRSWFAKRHDGDCPSISEVRKRAGAVKQGLPSL